MKWEVVCVRAYGGTEPLEEQLEQTLKDFESSNFEIHSIHLAPETGDEPAHFYVVAKSREEES